MAGLLKTLNALADPKKRPEVKTAGLEHLNQKTALILFAVAEAVLGENFLAKAPKFARAQDVPFSILLPAFVTSELKTAFQIGFLLFLPFLVIDLVVSSVLMSLGMMMMSPMLVSLPFKLLLFVLVDGWALLMGSLASSFV